MTITNDWTITWRDKSFPPSADGVAASRVGEQGWHLGADFMTPVAALTHSALTHNAARMRAYCAEHDIQIAPHGKTSMSPELAALQLDHGAWGLTAATAWQARVFVEFGVRRILIANECLDPVGLRMLAELLRRTPGLEILAFVDSIAAVTAMQRALQTESIGPFPVLVEVGAAHGRAGARDVDSAVEVGRAVARTQELELAGVGCFEGVLGGTREPDDIAAVTKLLTTSRQVAEQLMQDEAFRADRPVILTAGGSAFFDRVVDVFTAERSSYRRPVEVVIRSGCYITHDHGTYRQLSPFAGSGRQEFRPALHVWARVVSTPESGLALIDAGKRDVSSDGLLPLVVGRYRDGLYQAVDDVPALAGAAVQQMNDQHGYVFVPSGSEALRVGDLVVLGVSHPCTTLDKWRVIPVVDDEHRVVTAARTYF